ncbi:MAG: DUF2007 domain-containing protein [Flavobacteriaceae bacterium]
MANNTEFVTVFSGSEVEVLMLKGLLEGLDIEGIIQNDYQSGIIAGFGGGTISTVRLKINESDMEKAQTIITEFKNNR